VLFADYVEFNAAKGHPFADPDLRRAVAYALDRPAIAAASGSGFTNGMIPDDSMIAPNFADLPEMPFPDDGPDLAEARRLLGDAHPHVVMPLSSGCDFCRTMEDEVVDQLKAVGFAVETVEDPNVDGAIHDHPGKFDLAVSGSAPEWPDLASYLPLLFGEYIPQEWLPDEIGAGASAVADAPDAEREQRAREFLAGPVADLVPATAFGTPVAGSLLSPRLGCQVFPPFGFGVDLAAMCPKGSSAANPTA
jgi:ABC-type transport system substrate-binding protein